MRGIILFCGGLLVALAVVIFASFAHFAYDAYAYEAPVSDGKRFVSVNDKTNNDALERMRHESEKARAREVADAIASFKAAEAEREPVYDCGESAYDYEEPAYDYQAPVCGYAPTDGLTREGGVNYFDGRTETYYSSNVLYHKDTPSWTLDDEGFYRDAEGRYVVAASDKAQGETFEGSKGECIVLDTGCAPGVTDYYCAW